VRRLSPLTTYVGCLSVVGLPLAAWLLWGSLGIPPGRPWTAIVTLSIALVLAELLPIEIMRGTQTYAITISGTFSFALVLVAPLGVALVAQLIALGVDELRQGRRPLRLLFNVAQYTLTFTAARLTFAALAGEPLLGATSLPPSQLPAVAAAAAVYFLTNRILVGIVQALTQRTSVASVLLKNVRMEVLTVGIELGLAPLAITTTDYTPFLLPLLLLPIAAVHKSANLAAKRDHDALHDVLTGLPNRALLQIRFSEYAGKPGKDARPLTVMLIDLDHFKEINDTLGHHVGDLLLAQVATRLASVVRENDIVARLGGDEFAVLSTLQPESSRAQAEALAERLVRVLEEPFTLNEVRIDIQASLGIALAPEHGTAIELLMSRADIALYEAKEDRGRWAVYDPESDEHTPARLSLLGELREGIDRDELELRYQPKVDLRTNTVVGVEALARWRHPTKGMLGPLEFIPLAENTGLIGPLTLVVLDKALAQTRRWLDVGWSISLAVNLSVRHLTDLQLPIQVEAALRRHNVPAELLTLEMTESSIMNDPSRAEAVLDGLRALGVRIAVDDYGTGYSSLAYLQRLKVDELKIDRSFVRNLAGSDNDEVIVRSTIELGHNLGLQVVAEGVEDLDVWRRLADLSCDMVQGFLLSPPIPAGELTHWLQERKVAGGRPSSAKGLIVLNRAPGAVSGANGDT
jgi:diguanylate cyclase (GGDEF)-like protein